MKTVVKIIGVASILLGLFTSFFVFIALYFPRKNPIPNALPLPYHIANALILLITGYYLFKLKISGIYVFGALIALTVVKIIYQYTNQIQAPTMEDLLWLLVYLAVFAWFFSNKKKFSK